MSLSRLMARWQGALLSLIGIVATVWLGTTGQLSLYIHPQYFGFSLVMAVVAAAIVLASFALGSDDDHEHEHEHDHELTSNAGLRWFWGSASVVVVSASALALLALPPTTLTTATLEQRELNGSAGALTTTASTELVGGDASTFTVKDWASLLQQGAGPEFYAGKTAEITGFVTPDKDDPDNVFYVARFVVTHCVVDAQPVGVPVYRPGWQDEIPLDSWVGVSGGLTANPSVVSSEAIVVVPQKVTAVEVPEQPYVY
jgi:uncharacterized repeat protein (TIGR03943 family)